MFVLSQIEHNLPMPPHLLSRPLVDAIKAELERLFLDKVINYHELSHPCC
jgi:DNA-directed RNA polymerase III subunit RPC8